MGRRAITIRFDPETQIERFDRRITIGGDGEIRAWANSTDEIFDSVALLFVSDALPPATFGVVQTGWVPTLQLSTYVRRIPRPGPIIVRFRAQLLRDGFADEICEAWDSDGNLIMQSTQLAALRLPKKRP